VSEAWLDSIHWDEKGLLPAIVQDAATGEVLMFAWMNREALQRTAETQTAVFWSRSRNALWHKGEQSGHTQRVRELRLDCDQDVILLRVDQLGGIACHTGRKSCFFQRLENGVWQTVLPVLKDPKDIYR
jgi:phosphoribosyl-AMP cyclohydrolase